MEAMKLRGGFTLIEILIAMAIVGILASAALVGLSGVRQTARDSKRMTELRQVQTALELYYRREGSYPLTQSWNALVGTLAPVEIPSDPSYEYASNDGTEYVLKAMLEAYEAELKTDVDGNNIQGLDCGVDGPDEREFCIKF